uniref:Uncharacterized protein n=1 Tax=Wuchereria bancrofti TaxID=6293 RepID=A0AAF5PGD5_WUCBA
MEIISNEGYEIRIPDISWK